MPGFSMLIKRCLTVFIFFYLTIPAYPNPYRVCYIPPDDDNKVIRFCPAGDGIGIGSPCECSNGSVDGGRISIIEITASQEGTENAPSVCASNTPRTSEKVALCGRFHSVGNAACRCADGTAGSIYNLEMLPRFTFRTNPVAASDFLKRLKECCVAK